MRRLSGIAWSYAAAAVLGAVFCLSGARAEQPIARVGVLSVPPIAESLRDALRRRGYIEGKNIAFEWRSANANDRDMRSQAAELVRAKVDVIVTFTTPAARAALTETTTIPVVFSSGDPVATGLAANLVRPGGNGTGVSVVATELVAKRLDLLHQLAPTALRVAYLTNSSNPLGAVQLEQAQKTAPMLGLELVVLDAKNPTELNQVLGTLHQKAADAVLVTADLLFQLNKSVIAGAVRNARLPAMVPYKIYLEDGVLGSYGPDIRELSDKMASYVERILKGAKPSDLPIEQMSKYELVINLRVARALQLKVPQELLYRADEVIR
jgi:putative ABC transport system substrate-binding protein